MVNIRIGILQKGAEVLVCRDTIIDKVHMSFIPLV